MPSWSPESQLELHQANRSHELPDDELHFSRSLDRSSLVFPSEEAHPLPASGFDPGDSWFISSDRSWSPGDILEFNFEMSIKLRHAHPKVKDHQGKVTLTRGPLVYCLENIDNPEVDIFNLKLNTTSVHYIFDKTLLGGIMKIEAKTTDGQAITFIPYHLWGNRGPSQMTVWVNA